MGAMAGPAGGPFDGGLLSMGLSRPRPAPALVLALVGVPQRAGTRGAGDRPRPEPHVGDQAPPLRRLPRAARAPDVRGWTVVSRRSSELVPQFEGEGHGNQLSVAVPHQLCAGRVALASEPPAEAPDQTDSVAEARRRRQLA